MNVVDCRFIYNNLIRNVDVIPYVTTEHPQFPVENIQDDSILLPWRSRYGTGTGNGTFLVTAGVNNKINFDEGGAELTATLTAGTYNGQTLATEVKTQLDAAGGTYTVSYTETTGKFTIARAAGNFTLRWNTGTNKAVDASGLLGFSDAADDTGADTYDSDTVVIHSHEQVQFDLGVATEYDSVAILGHNLTASAVIYLQGADNDAFTTNLVSDTLTYNSSNIYQFLDNARTKRYVRILIYDVANPSMYVQIGTLVVGKYLSLNRAFGPYGEGKVDETELEYGPAGVPMVTQERTALVNRELLFQGLNTTSSTGIMAMLAECGRRKAVWLCVDSTSANTSSYWVGLKEYGLPRYEYYDYWTWETTLEERL